MSKFNGDPRRMSTLFASGALSASLLLVACGPTKPKSPTFLPVPTHLPTEKPVPPTPTVELPAVDYQPMYTQAANLAKQNPTGLGDLVNLKSAVEGLKRNDELTVNDNLSSARGFLTLPPRFSSENGNVTNSYLNFQLSRQFFSLSPNDQLVFMAYISNNYRLQKQVLKYYLDKPIFDGIELQATQAISALRPEINSLSLFGEVRTEAEIRKVDPTYRSASVIGIDDPIQSLGDKTFYDLYQDVMANPDPKLRSPSNPLWKQAFGLD